MRDFEKDRKICEAATRGPWRSHQTNVLAGGHTLFYTYMANQRDAEFVAAAREGWPEALDRIEELELEIRMLKLIANDRQRLDESLDAAAEMRFKEAADNPEEICFKCERYEDNSCPQERKFCVWHWRDYWRRKSGTFQNGNDHGTTEDSSGIGSISRKETVGGGEGNRTPVQNLKPTD